MSARLPPIERPEPGVYIFIAVLHHTSVAAAKCKFCQQRRIVVSMRTIPLWYKEHSGLTPGVERAPLRLKDFFFSFSSP